MHTIISSVLLNDDKAGLNKYVTAEQDNIAQISGAKRERIIEILGLVTDSRRQRLRTPFTTSQT